MAEEQIPYQDYSRMIANILGSKGGFDFSSSLMDPVMQYLNGTYQAAPQFTEDDLYNRTAPTFQWAGAEPQDSSWFQAAKAIRQGINPFNIKRDKKMREASGISPDEWTSFVDSLMKENQSVKTAMLDQGMQQDPFQKMGMPGAKESYADLDQFGGLKNQDAVYNASPQFFADLFSKLPEQRTAQNLSEAKVNAKYGGNVYASSDKDKMAALMRDAGDEPLSVIEQQQLDLYKTQPHIQAEMIERMRRSSARRALGKAGTNKVVDKRATAARGAYAQALKDAMGRTAGTASDTLRLADDASQQLVAQMIARGQTPLKDALLNSAILKKSTKNGN